MGSEEFSQSVRGARGDPIQMTEQGSITTNNFNALEGFTLSGGDTFNPDFKIEEITFTEIGAKSLTVTATLHNGGTGEIPMRGAVMSVDTLEIESVQINDPKGTGGVVHGFAVGEQE